jgi:hypothetical protein
MSLSSGRIAEAGGMDHVVDVTAGLEQPPAEVPAGRPGPDESSDGIILIT